MKQYTGRTLDEVLNSIASEQGCQVQDITYNVLEEEKGGIFGLHKSITIEAFTSKDVKEFIFDYLGAYFTELNQGVAIEIIVEKEMNFFTESSSMPKTMRSSSARTVRP